MSDDKPPKPMPTAAEINAYLEQSAARTRMRLPLAKGQVVAKRVQPPPVDPTSPAPKPMPAGASRALPLQGSKKLPMPAETNDVNATPVPKEGGWRPFGSGEE